MNNLFNFSQPLDNDAKALFNDENQSFLAELVAVSYTHLTLPTNREV